jgi:hypothetical protein
MPRLALRKAVAQLGNATVSVAVPLHGVVVTQVSVTEVSQVFAAVRHVAWAVSVDAAHSRLNEKSVPVALIDLISAAVSVRTSISRFVFGFICKMENVEPVPQPSPAKSFVWRLWRPGARCMSNL